MCLLLGSRVYRYRVGRNGPAPTRRARTTTKGRRSRLLDGFCGRLAVSVPFVVYGGCLSIPNQTVQDDMLHLCARTSREEERRLMHNGEPRVGFTEATTLSARQDERRDKGALWPAEGIRQGRIYGVRTISGMGNNLAGVAGKMRWRRERRRSVSEVSRKWRHFWKCDPTKERPLSRDGPTRSVLFARVSRKWGGSCWCIMWEPVSCRHQLIYGTGSLSSRT
jgi:hypothetical protein